MELIKQILSDAAKITSIDRRNDYNEPKENFEDASMILKSNFDIELKPSDIIKVLISLKLSREKYKHKYDNLLDTIGYIAILHELLENENDVK